MAVFRQAVDDLEIVLHRGVIDTTLNPIFQTLRVPRG